MNESVRTVEGAAVQARMDLHDAVQWQCRWKVEKYDPGHDPDGRPDEVVEGEGNLLTTVGANILWTKLIGGAGQVYDNSNAYIGVGDSNTAASAGQTDLQAASNKVRKAMDATYPSVATDTVTFRSSFGSSDGNFAWEEWAVFNASSSGTMLNRKVQSLGTKVSGATWVFTVTITLS